MTIQIKRGAAATWTADNPILAAGQPGFEVDTGRIKIGDGVTVWTALPYRFQVSAVEWADVQNRPTTFPPEVHGHEISAVLGLQTALDGKQAAGTYAASVHGHVIAEVIGLVTALAGKADTSHGHVLGDVTGLGAALAAKSDVGHGHALADVIGLQAALDGKAALSHVHPWAQITGVPVPIADTTAAFTTAQQTKLTGIAAGATVNATDGALRDRSTHTGTQAAGTITGLATVATTGAYSSLSGLPALFNGAYGSLSGIPATFPPSAHGHVWGDLSGVPATFAPSAHGHPWSQITDTPATFTPSAHGHVIADVTGLQAALDALANIEPLPAGGVPGQVLTRTAGGAEWEDLPDGPVSIINGNGPAYIVPAGFIIDGNG